MSDIIFDFFGRKCVAVWDRDRDTFLRDACTGDIIESRTGISLTSCRHWWGIEFKVWRPGSETATHQQHWLIERHCNSWPRIWIAQLFTSLEHRRNFPRGRARVVRKPQASPVNRYP